MGAFFVAISQIISLGLGYIIRVILARNLSLEEFGLYYAVFGLIGFFLMFRDLGFGTALGKLIPNKIINNKMKSAHSIIWTSILIQLAFSTIIAILLFLTKDFFAKYYFKQSSASALIMIFIIYIFFSAFALWQKQIFRCYKKDFLFSLTEPLKNIINLVLIFGFFRFFDGAIVPSLSVSLSWLLIFFILLPHLIKTHSFFHKIEKFKESTRELFKVGVPAMFNDFGDRMITRIDTLVLTYFSGLAQVGIYNAVYPTSFLFSIIGKSFFPIILPHLSELDINKDKKTFESLVKTLYKYSLLITLPLIIIAIVFSKDIIKILFGSEYISGYIAFIILIFGALFNSIILVNNAVLISINMIKKISSIITITLIFNIVCNLILVPIFGINGAATTSLISYLIILIMSTKYLRVKINVKIEIEDIIKMISLSIILVLIALIAIKLIHTIIIWKIIFVSLIILVSYLIGIVLFKLSNLNEIKRIFEREHAG